MAKITNALILGVVLACTFCFAECAVIDPIEPEPDASQYHRFFQKLTEAEKRALISLAVAFHDAPDSADDTIVFPINPIKPKSEEIPPTLFTSMMNGKIPNGWMKKFVRWLRNNMQITDESLNLFRHDFADVLCTADNKCYSVSDVGQNCCPFG